MTCATRITAVRCAKALTRRYNVPMNNTQKRVSFDLVSFRDGYSVRVYEIGNPDAGYIYKNAMYTSEKAYDSARDWARRNGYMWCE